MNVIKTLTLVGRGKDRCPTMTDVTRMKARFAVESSHSTSTAGLSTALRLRDTGKKCARN